MFLLSISDLYEISPSTNSVEIEVIPRTCQFPFDVVHQTQVRSPRLFNLLMFWSSEFEISSHQGFVLSRFKKRKKYIYIFIVPTSFGFFIVQINGIR